MEVDEDGPVMEDSGPGRRRRVHGMLKLYYGLNEEGKAEEKPESLDPCDINGPHFDPELFLNKVRVHHCHGKYLHRGRAQVRAHAMDGEIAFPIPGAATLTGPNLSMAPIFIVMLSLIVVPGTCTSTDTQDIFNVTAHQKTVHWKLSLGNGKDLMDPNIDINNKQQTTVTLQQ